MVRRVFFLRPPPSSTATPPAQKLAARAGTPTRRRTRPPSSCGARLVGAGAASCRADEATVARARGGVWREREREEVAPALSREARARARAATDLRTESSGLTSSSTAPAYLGTGGPVGRRSAASGSRPLGRRARRRAPTSSARRTRGGTSMHERASRADRG